MLQCVVGVPLPGWGANEVVTVMHGPLIPRGAVVRSAVRHASKYLTGRWIHLLALAALWLLAACNQGTTIGANQAVGESKKAAERTVNANDLKQKGGLCDLNKRVSNPDPNSPESVIWRMYQLAQAPDTEETFAQFVALFPADRDARGLRENYWPRVRANVRKYVVEPGKPDFVICRTAFRDTGTMYYITTQDPRQSPPPITVGPADGTNKIVFLTPF